MMWRLRVLIPGLAVVGLVQACGGGVTTVIAKAYGKPASLVYIRGRMLLGSAALPGNQLVEQVVKENHAARPAHAAHPLAGQQMAGAEMIVQVLADEGVEPSSATAAAPSCRPTTRCSVYNEAQAQRRRAQMPLIVPANEQGAGFMAAGYARASGRVGVCLVTSGPGRDQHGHAGPRLHGGLDSRSS